MGGMEFSALALLLMVLGAVLCKLIERLVGWARAMGARSSSSTTSMAAGASTTRLTTEALEETTSRSIQVAQRRVEVNVSIAEDRNQEPEQDVRERRAAPKPKVQPVAPKPMVQPSGSAMFSSASNEQHIDRQYPVKRLINS